MSYLRAVEPGPKFAPLDALRELFGFVPNLFRAQTLLPRAIEAEAALTRAVLFEERALSRVQKESVLLAVAAAHGNVYCVTKHHRILRSLGSPESQLDRILIGHRQAGLSGAGTALIDFALELARNAPWFSERDISALRDHGWNDESILEGILVTALAGFFCTLSIGLGPAPDFEPRAVSFAGTAPPDPRSYVGGTAGPYLRAVELSPQSFPPFSYFLERFGAVPGIFRAQTLRPDVIAAEAEVFRSVLEPQDILSRMQKECILLVVSAANLNTYCVAAHCEMLRRMGLSVGESDQIAVDHRQADLSEANKTLLDFALKLAVHPSEFGREDIDRLRTRGFTEEQIIEAVVVTAFNNFINTLQMGLGTTPDLEPRHIFGPQSKPLHLPAAVDRPTKGGQVDPDAGLVARVQDGDLDAFEELVARHSRRVYRTLIGIVGNVEEAQDAMQDTFLKAFQHIGEFQARSRFATWLVTIAGNTGVQRLRERRPVESLDDVLPEADAGFRPRQVRAWSEDPEQLCSQAERRGLVESALMKVPPKYRVVLVLRDIEQLSGAEVAAALGLGIPAMKARLLRARLMLREALAPHFVSKAQRMGGI